MPGVKSNAYDGSTLVAQALDNEGAPFLLDSCTKYKLYKARIKTPL